MAKKDNTKVTLAKMTHGDMRRVNDALYITTYPNTELQNLININTGLTLQEIYVNKFITNYWHTQHSNVKPKYSYKDAITRCKGGLVLVAPQQNLGQWEARLYSERGECIFILKNITGIGQYSAVLKDNKVLVVLRDNTKTYRVLVWDKNEQKIIENYIGIANMHSSVKGIHIKQLDGAEIINHLYELGV